MYSRVSSASMYKNVLGTLNSNLANYQNLIRQQTTLQKYAKLSENLSAVSRSLEMAAEITTNTQYQENNKVALSMLKYSETAMDQVLNAAQDIRELIIQAGDGALSADELEDIVQQIDAKRSLIIDALNTKIAGQYIFGGSNTNEKPFTVNADGTITYHGENDGLSFALSDTLNGVVTFTGTDVLGEKENSFFVCSHEVGLDWAWTGREEKVQITVGNRTIAVYIPENWIDEITTAETKPTDYNRFRDPEEVTGISLSDLATLINRSLEEQGADMLVNAYVQKGTNTQQLFIKSNTGEEIGITGWTDTDYLPMAQSLAGLEFPKSTGSTTTLTPPFWNDTPFWNSNTLTGVDISDPNFNFANLDGKTLKIYVNDDTANPIDVTFDSLNNADDIIKQIKNEIPSTANLEVSTAPNGKLVLTSQNGESIQVDTSGSATEALFGSATKAAQPTKHGLMGSESLLGWRSDGLGKGIQIQVGAGTLKINLDGAKSISDLIEIINTAAQKENVDCTASIVTGRLVLQSSTGKIEVSDTVPNTGGTEQLFGVKTIESSTSSLTVQVAGESVPTTIYVNSGEKLTDIAKKLNAIEGVYARTSADKDQLVVVAQRIGDAVGDRLSTDAAKEALHYPELTLKAAGAALQLFDFDITTDSESGQQIGSLKSKPETRAVDHSHMDVFDVLGMETALKSVEYGIDQALEIKDGTNLHWRVISGDRTAEISFESGNYTLSQIADRLRHATSGWLDVVVDVSNPDKVNSDQSEYADFNTSYNSEDATQRLVIRGRNGQEVILIDVNEQHYADELGLSTALRANPDMGLKDIIFPDAACVDDNIGAQMRVQMNCGMTYDVTIKKSDVTDPASGLVVREKVMEQIVRQVNAQEGADIMGIAYPANEFTKKEDDMASIYFLSGEPFTVVDLPFNDPKWDNYSGGIAAQMGIHGGVTANLAQVGPATASGKKMTDSMTFKEAAGGAVSGTIKFECLGHSVDVDVREGDKIVDVMDRVRAQAGDWLYVNYFDAHMGAYNASTGTGASRSGDYPIIAFSAKDGSAVSITDVKGTIAQDYLGISTGIQGSVDVRSMTWDTGVTPSNPAARVFEINVAGYTHKIDMTAMRDINNNDKMDCEDLVATINARMQDYDVMAEINDDGHLVLSSLRGYSISASVYEVDNDGNRTTDLTGDFFGGKSIEGTVDVTAKSWTDTDIPQMYFGIKVLGTPPFVKDINMMTEITGRTAGKIDCVDLVTAINADTDMQDHGVSAEIRDGRLVLSSLWGNSISASVYEVDNNGNRTTELTGDFLGVAKSIKSFQGTYDISGDTWSLLSAPIFTIDVNGTSYKVNVSASADLDNDNEINCEELVAAINAEMQDDGLIAEITSDGYLVLSSLRGDPIDVSVSDANGNDLTSAFFGIPTTVTTSAVTTSKVTTYYRGGYKLGDDAENRVSNGIHTQTATIRSGSNTMRQDAFGVIGDISAAIKAGNRDALSELMLPRIDKFINNILSVMSTNGAYQNRYTANLERLQTNNIIMEEEQQELVGINLAEVATAIAEANYAYSTNLYALSTLMNQPTLLDFLR